MSDDDGHGKKKWLLLGLIALVTLPIGGPIILALFVFPIILKVLFVYPALIVIYFIYITFLVIVGVPAKLIFGSARAVSNFFRKGFIAFTVKPKTSLVVSVPIFLLMLTIFPVGFSELFSVQEAATNTFSLLQALLWTVLIAFGVLRAYTAVVGISVEDGEARYKSTGQQVNEAVQGATEKLKKYNDVRETKNELNKWNRHEPETSAGKKYKKIHKYGGGGHSSLARNIAEAAGKLREDIGGIPVLGDIIAGIMPEMKPAEMSKKSALFRTAGYGMFLGGIGIILVAIILVLWYLILSFIIGPYLAAAGALLSSVGLGFLDFSGNYANWAGSTIANDYLVGIGETVEPAANTYNQAKARVFCLLEGPACLRNKTFAQTSRPGSNEVGESYGLQLDEFTFGRNRFDIRSSTANTTIPMSFTVSNPRRGLKGVTARDLAYRVQVIDFDRSPENPYCDSGWIRMNNLFDTDDDLRSNDLYPGTSGSSGFVRITEDKLRGPEAVNERAEGLGQDGEPATEDIGEAINLKNCELLQPGAGVTRTVVLYLKYDYFSQATLYFDAMSVSEFRRNPDITIQTENSETADTPAQVAMNIREPMLFEDSGGARTSRVRSIRATLNTEDSDVSYQVKDFEVRNSRFLDIANRDVCSFEGDDRLTLRKGSEEQLIPEYPSRSFFTTSEPIGSNWFDKDSPPPPFGCPMNLSRGSISVLSPSGTTLNIGVASNYTVSTREQVGNFEVLNRVCARANCPLLVSVHENASYPDYNFRVVCDDLDSSNGCTSVRTADPDNFHQNWNSLTVSRPANSPIDASSSSLTRGSDTYIDEGEIVIDLKEVATNKTVFSSLSGNDKFRNAGIDLENWRRLDYDLDGTLDPNEGSYSGFVPKTAERNMFNWSIVQYRKRFSPEVEVEFQELSDRTCQQVKKSGSLEPIHRTFAGLEHRTVTHRCNK